MDGRKWLVAVLSLSWGCVGCITQVEHKLPGSAGTTTTTQVTLPFVDDKDEKKIPKASTVVAFARYQELEARQNQNLSPSQKDRMLDIARVGYLKALELEPNQVEAMLGLGRVYTALRNYERAEQIYQEGLNKHPKDARLWFGLGTYHCRRKNYPQAVACYERAHELSPEDRDCTATLGYTLILANQIPESVQVFSRLYGNEAKAHYRVALMMAWQNNWDAAKHHATTAVRLDPNMSNAREMLAQMSQPTNPDNASANPVINVSFRDTLPDTAVETPRNRTK